ATGPAPSPAPEDRLALVHERLRGFAMVLGLAAPRVVPRLEVEQLRERAALGRIHVALHVAVGDARAARQPRGERQRLLLEAGVGNHAIDEAEGLRLRRVDDVGRVIELARLRGADELGEVEAAAEVARVAHAREGGGETRAV